jgi:hypothetical protein
VRYYKGFFNEQQLPRPCNYVSVMETADFSFSTAYLTTTEFWDAGGHGMGDLNEDVRGEQARVDKGYLCRCYRGNPYVVGGCTGFLFLSPLDHSRACSAFPFYFFVRKHWNMFVILTRHVDFFFFRY